MKNLVSYQYPKNNKFECFWYIKKIYEYKKYYYKIYQRVHCFDEPKIF